MASPKLSPCLNEAAELFTVSALVAAGDTVKMLSDSLIRSAKPSLHPCKLADSRGLYLQVMPNGGKYWRFDYRFNAKRRTLALGVYPDVPLIRARERHHEARRLLAEGVDPAAARQAVSRDFEAVARAWHEHWKTGRTEHYAQSVKTRLETDIFPQIGRRPIAELSPADFRDAVRKIERRGAFEIARRLLQNCGQIMRYAVANDLAPRNPVAEVRPADILTPRKRRNHPRVTAKELPDLLRAIDGYVGSEHTRLALQLMSLTFVRTSELIGARWSEFDFKESRWDIPAGRMKMKTPHVVALSVQSQAILQLLKEISFDRELIFPGDINPRKPMSTNTLLFALYRMGYRGRMTGHGFRGVCVRRARPADSGFGRLPAHQKVGSPKPTGLQSRLEVPILTVWIYSSRVQQPPHARRLGPGSH